MLHEKPQACILLEMDLIYLRDIECVKTEKFKFELDKFLELNSDEKKMPNYDTPSGRNSIHDELTNLRLKKFTTVVESPTRPWSSPSCFETTPSIQVTVCIESYYATPTPTPL